MNWQVLPRLLLLLPLVFCDTLHGAEKQKLIGYKKGLASQIEKYLSVSSANKYFPIANIVLEYLGLDNFGWVDKHVIRGKFQVCAPYNFTKNFFSKKSGLGVVYAVGDKKKIVTFDNLQCTSATLEGFNKALQEKKAVTYMHSSCQTLRLRYTPDAQGVEAITLQRYALTPSGCTIL